MYGAFFTIPAHYAQRKTTGCVPAGQRLGFECTRGVSAYLVVAAAFKAVEGLLTQSLVGSIPIHSRCDQRTTEARAASADRAGLLSPAPLLNDRA